MIINYKEEIVLHIQGLEIDFSNHYLELDEVKIKGMTPDISIKEIGGYIPQLLHILYLDDGIQKQAYMTRYEMGNLRCIPTLSMVEVDNPFYTDFILEGDPIGVIIHLPPFHIQNEGWLALYQNGMSWITSSYKRLDSYKRLEIDNIIYLQLGLGIF